MTLQLLVSNHNQQVLFSMFAKAHLNATTRLIRKLFGRTIQPLRTIRDLKVDVESLTNRYYAGTQTIDVDQIHGTVDRYGDFDYDFHPLHETHKHRWCSVASAILGDVCLPPIEVIKVGDEYFVKDGHHRISVARALGKQYIDAIVEVWE